jgi:hypothetical protein
MGLWGRGWTAVGCLTSKDRGAKKMLKRSDSLELIITALSNLNHQPISLHQGHPNK